VDPSVVLPDHHESAATDVSRDWMDHCEREGHGHGGVDRVAAAAQNVHANIARERMRCYHHGMLAGDGPDALAQRPVGRDERGTGRPFLCTRPGRRLGRRLRGGDEYGDVGRDGDRLRQLDAAAARHQHEQPENRESAHAELCTLTRVRVNV